MTGKQQIVPFNGLKHAVLNHKRQAFRYVITLKDAMTEACDALASRLANQHSSSDATAAQAARSVIRSGIGLAFILFGIGGAWAALAPLDSAAVAPGHVVLGSSRKVIQHLEGGIVDEILVQEGEQVKKGQVLIRLHETASGAKLESLKHQYYLARASEARLIAERDKKEEVDYERLAKEMWDYPDYEEIIANQNQIFQSHRSTLDSQIHILGKKINEYRHEIEGLEALVKSQTNEIAMLDEEIKTNKQLLAQGNSTKSRLLALQRQQESLRGERGKNTAAIAQSEQSIAEAELEIVKLEQQRMADTVSELKDIQLEIADLQERIRASTDVHDRIVIMAPLTGYVTSLNVHTVGGVVAPGEKLLEIVPTDDKLIIEAQVAPQDIDVVYPGMIAHVRLSAYKTRYMPSVDGKVMTVSADRITDERTNESYYLARIETDAEQMNALEGIKLYPGMPADVLIVTGSRTLLGYLFDPIRQTINKSFRED